MPTLEEYEALLPKPQSTTPAPTDFGPLDYLQQAGGSLVRGFGNMVAAIPEGVQTAREAITGLIPEQLKPLAGAAASAASSTVPLAGALTLPDVISQAPPGETPLTGRLLRGAGYGIRRATEAVAPEQVPGLENSFWASSVPQGIGSSLGFLLGGEALAPLKIPQWLSIAGIGSLASGQDFYNDAKLHGADERTAQISSLLGNVVGTSEAVGLGRIMSRLDRLTGNSFTKAVIESGKQTLEEALQEGAQQLAQNWTAQTLFDKDRPLFDDVFSNAGAGGVTGFLYTSLAHALGIPGRLEASAENRASRAASVDRIKNIISQREGDQYAKGTGTQITTGGQEEGLQQETGGGLRLRDITQNRLEAATGTPLTEFESRIPPAFPENEQGLGHALKNVSQLIKLGTSNGFITPEQAAQFQTTGDTIFSTRNETGFKQAIQQVENLRQNISETLRQTGPTQEFESRRPIQRIPIQVQQADGTVVQGEFTGYYDLRELGRGVVPSIGVTLPDGSVTHGLLKPDEKIIGAIPSFEQWQQPERRAGPALTPIGEPAIRQRLEILGARPDSKIRIVNEPNSAWDAKSQFDNRGNLFGILINAANIGDVTHVDSALEHEASHAVEQSGIAAEALSTLTDQDKISIYSDMVRLGYPTMSQQEIDARGIETLSNAFKNRNWFQRVVAAVLQLATKLNFRMTRLAAERIAARAVGRQIKNALTTPQRNAVIDSEFQSKVQPETPSQFTSRQQVNAILADPALKPSQKQVVKDLAEVQSSMVSDKIMGFLMATPKDAAEKYAQNTLSYLEDRRYMADVQRWLDTLPTATNDQKQTKEVVSAAILKHYGVDRLVEQKINNELDVSQGELAQQFQRLKILNSAQIKANFMSGMFKNLTTLYKTYLANLTATAPANKNLQHQYIQRLINAERKLNEQEQSPTAVQKALQAIAVTIPDTLLQPGITNQQIVDWVVQNGALNTVVGDSVKDWLLEDKGNGLPALLGYSALRQDLSTLRELLNNQQAVGQELKSFEQWFRPSGTPGKVPAKNFAEAYFKFRTSRDRAVKIASQIEKEIEADDAKAMGNIIARERLQELMRSPDYVKTVRDAAKNADVVVRALYDSPLGRTRGIIERGAEPGAGTAGYWNIKGPMTGTDYVVDLYPSNTQEQKNQTNLQAAAGEFREWAEAHNTSDPLLADEYSTMAAYIEKHLIHPSLNPKAGFIQLPWVRIPGTTARIPLDPFDFVLGGVSSVFSFQTIKDVIERVGGRPVRQAFKDQVAIDVVMKKVEAADAHKEYGFAAQNEAVRKAVASHGWSMDNVAQWLDDVSEKIIASGQNPLSSPYETGDILVGTGIKITKADMDSVRLMKRWEDAIYAAAPSHIKDLIGDLTVLRKAIGGGRFTMARIPSAWTYNLQQQWKEANTPEKKWNFLSQKDNFKNILMGIIGENNHEFSLMNPASPKKSPLFDIYRYAASQEKSGSQRFATADDLLAFVAKEMVDRGMSPSFVEAYSTAKKQMISEAGNSIESFISNVIGREPNKIWGVVPEAIVRAATANNSFTNPRGEMVAPSPFYSYSTGLDARRLMHISHLRSLMNLNLIQSVTEARTALKNKKEEFDKQIGDLIKSGKSRKSAGMTVFQQSVIDRKNSEIRYDYAELESAIKAIDQALGPLERFESSRSEEFQHAGAAMLTSVMGAQKAFLLASTMSMTTNTFGGTLLGPALIHAQAGLSTKAMRDVFIPPHVGKLVVGMVSKMVLRNPTLSKILSQDGAFWESLADNVARKSADFQRAVRMTHDSGMVAPYNLAKVLDNRAALKSTGGRIESGGVHAGPAMVNSLMSMWGPRHYIEALRATFPRIGDNWINYSLMSAFQIEENWLKSMGRRAFKIREEAAQATGSDWRDLSNRANILTPGDFGMKSHKGLSFYRDLFIPVGSLDHVMLDYYDRTKGMTEHQAAAAPLIPSYEDEMMLALEYATKTNVASETNRPKSFHGKGSDGLWRNMVGTFMGWTTNMTKELSRVLQSHSKDPGFDVNHYIAAATLVMLMAAVGAWNWEFGDELKQLFVNQHSARIQLGNIKDVGTGVVYFLQSLVNTVPVIGSSIGSLGGVVYTGRGTPFDMTSQSIWLGLPTDIWNTAKRIIQTGDAVLPLGSFITRWGGDIPKAIINRLPTFRGLLDNSNAVRALNASAPSGVEIKWGQGGLGNIKYSPANDEVQKLIASAYEALYHGGSQQDIWKRREEAIQAFIAQGKTPQEAENMLGLAISAKEPIRTLTGKEMTAEEEQKWVARMTPEQKADYAKATAAFALLGQIMGKDFNMVSTPSGGGGGGGGNIGGITSPLGAGGLGRSALPKTSAASVASYLRTPKLTGTTSLTTFRHAGLPVLRRPKGLRTGRRALRRLTRTSRSLKLSRLRRTIK